MEEEHRRLEAAGDVENSKIAQTQILETEDERRTRLVSLRIIYFTMFLMTLGFSIILTGIWPYLDKVISVIVKSINSLKIQVTFS